MVLGVGILSTANIARKNARAIALSEHCRLIAVASRTLSKAQDFVADTGIEGVKAYGSYDELLADVDVQAVYIPLPTAMHLEWIRKSALAGKHILIEKPVSITMEDMNEMVEVCKELDVVLLDGLMFQHHERHSLLLAELNDTFTGPVHSIQSSFSFNGDKTFLESNIRVKAGGDPLGALGDLGWYQVRLALLAFSAKKGAEQAIQLPTRVWGSCSLFSEEGVPLDTHCTMEYACADGRPPRLARFDSSFRSAFRQSFEIVCLGERGCCDKVFRCEDFVIPRSSVGASFSVESIPSGFPGVDHATQIVTSTDLVEVRGCRQEVRMFDTLARLCDGKRVYRAEEQEWLGYTVATQKVCSALLSSIRANGAPVTLT
jgi:predicted dehydrogenase